MTMYTTLLAVATLAVQQALGAPGLLPRAGGDDLAGGSTSRFPTIQAAVQPGNASIDGNATLPVSAPPRKLYPIDSETSLVLFFATHPFPKKSNESAPSTDATLKVIQKATTSLADRPETLPEDIETRFTERVDSPRGPLEASIDFPPSSSPCRTDLAITGLGFVADIVQREGTRQSLGFNVIKGDVICTFFADVKLTKSNAVPVDEEDGIPTAKW